MSGRENVCELKGRERNGREEGVGPMGRVEASKRHEKRERLGKIGTGGPERDTR
jgi:hypothetical protein